MCLAPMRTYANCAHAQIPASVRPLHVQYTVSRASPSNAGYCYITHALAFHVHVHIANMQRNRKMRNNQIGNEKTHN